MKNIRLFWQIFPAIILTTLCAVVAVTLFISSTGRSFYIDELKEGIRDRAYLIESPVIELAAGPQEPLFNYIKKAGRKAQTRITLVAGDGTVLADSNEDCCVMDNHANRPEVKKALAGEVGDSIRYSKTVGSTMLYVAIPIEFKNGNNAALRVSVPITAYEKKLNQIRLVIFFIGLAIIGVAVFFAYYSARRISSPLEKMKEGAERLTKGRIDQLVEISSDHMSVEMAGLAGALNKMAGEINRRIRVIIHQRNELEAVFSSMADSVVAIDPELKILRMNQAASELFALTPGAVSGESIHGVIRNQELLSLIEKVLEENTPLKEEVTLFDGTQPLILQCHLVPLCAENEVMGVLLVMHDLTKLNRLENIRQDFVANVSHELKTPITAIKGYVETLLDGALEDKDDATRFLTIVARQTNRLDAIIDDLLALSRIENKDEAGEVELSLQPVRPVFEAAIQTCSSASEKKNIEVVVEDDDQLEVQMNQPLLEQALINLLQNAISYGPEGSKIVLQASKSTTLAGGERINLSVIDQGPGIDREHLPRLFERFYRCDKARGRDLGGTGLGLAIVKHIAHAHKGRVDVVSTRGKGSTFTITIPAS